MEKMIELVGLRSESKEMLENHHVWLTALTGRLLSMEENELAEECKNLADNSRLLAERTDTEFNDPVYMVDRMMHSGKIESFMDRVMKKFLLAD